MLNEFSIDPGIALTARCIVALLFASAVVHKLRSPAVFVSTLENYRLVPPTLAPPAGWAIMALEAGVAAALALGYRTAAFVAVGLLALYTGAIVINLIRGRRDIDCGCSGPAMRQTLSSWLVWRNLGMICLASLATLPVTARSLNALDAFSTIGALAAFFLIYSAANRLSATASRFVGQGQ